MFVFLLNTPSRVSLELEDVEVLNCGGCGGAGDGAGVIKDNFITSSSDLEEGREGR